MVPILGLWQIANLSICRAKSPLMHVCRQPRYHSSSRKLALHDRQVGRDGATSARWLEGAGLNGVLDDSGRSGG